MFAELVVGFGPAVWAVLVPGDALLIAGIGLIALVFAAFVGSGMRYIPNNRVGIVEKLWSPRGSVPEGRMMALAGEAGFQGHLPRGGLPFGVWGWQDRNPQGKPGTGPPGQNGYGLAPRRRPPGPPP